MTYFKNKTKKIIDGVVPIELGHNPLVSSPRVLHFPGPQTGSVPTMAVRLPLINHPGHLHPADLLCCHEDMSHRARTRRPWLGHLIPDTLDAYFGELSCFQDSHIFHISGLELSERGCHIGTIIFLSSSCLPP